MGISRYLVCAAVRVALVLVAVSPLGCATTGDFALHQDMPRALVEEHQDATNVYADEGGVWWPFICHAQGRIWRTHGGFAADRETAWGPLGLLWLGSRHGKYDAQGHVLTWSAANHWLWGFLGTQRAEGAVTNKGWRSSGGFWILHGLLGGGTGLDGSRTWRLLYMPISLSAGDPTVTVQDTTSAGADRAEKEPAVEEEGADETAQPAR